MTSLLWAAALCQRAAAQPILSGNFEQWTSPYNDDDLANEHSIPGDPNGDQVWLARFPAPGARTASVAGRRLHAGDYGCNSATSCEGEGRTSYFYAAALPTSVSGKTLHWHVEGTANMQPGGIARLSLFKNHFEEIAGFLLTRLPPVVGIDATIVAALSPGGQTVGSTLVWGPFTLDVAMAFDSADVTWNVNGVALSSQSAPSTSNDELGLSIGYTNAVASGSILRLSELTLTVE